MATFDKCKHYCYSQPAPEGLVWSPPVVKGRHDYENWMALWKGNKKALAFWTGFRFMSGHWRDFYSGASRKLVTEKRRTKRSSDFHGAVYTSSTEGEPTDTNNAVFFDNGWYNALPTDGEPQKMKKVVCACQIKG